VGYDGARQLRFMRRSCTAVVPAEGGGAVSRLQLLPALGLQAPPLFPFPFPFPPDSRTVAEANVASQLQVASPPTQTQQALEDKSRLSSWWGPAHAA